MRTRFLGRHRHSVFESVAESEITGCAIMKYAHGSAIWLQSSSRNRAIGNTVGPGTGGHGILLRDASEDSISDSIVQTQRGGGAVIVDESDDNQLHGTYVCGNNRGDIFVDADSTGNTGSDNTFNPPESNLEAKISRPCPENL
jgi:nitrous oxidase accessory protein NosD